MILPVQNDIFIYCSRARDEQPATGTRQTLHVGLHCYDALEQDLLDM